MLIASAAVDRSPPEERITSSALAIGNFCSAADYAGGETCRCRQLIFGNRCILHSPRDDPGLTTEAALIVTLLCGGVGVHYPGVAAGSAVAVAILLKASHAPSLQQLLWTVECDLFRSFKSFHPAHTRTHSDSHSACCQRSTLHGALQVTWKPYIPHRRPARSRSDQPTPGALGKWATEVFVFLQPIPRLHLFRRFAHSMKRNCGSIDVP